MEHAFGDLPFVTATPTNNIAQRINTSRLQALPGRQLVLQGSLEGNIAPDREALLSWLPTDDPLVLKEGEQVMLVRNDTQKRWVNGSIGVIAGDPHNSIRVDLGGNVYPVDKCTWEKVQYTYDAVEQKIVSIWLPERSRTDRPIRRSAVADPWTASPSVGKFARAT
jgi:hypothetical protein